MLATPRRGTLSTWSSDLAGLIDVLGLEKPTIFGLSFGGYVALAVAARHSEHVGRLVLDSTASRFDVTWTVEAFRRLGGDEAAKAAGAVYADPSPTNLAKYGSVCLPLYGQFRDEEYFEKRNQSDHQKPCPWSGTG